MFQSIYANSHKSKGLNELLMKDECPENIIYRVDVTVNVTIVYFIKVKMERKVSFYMYSFEVLKM